MNDYKDQEVRRLLKEIYKPADASPEFKEKLFNHLSEKLSAQTASPTRPSRAKPRLWGIVAAIIALVLIGYFVLLPLISSPTTANAGTLEIRVTDAPPERVVSVIDVTISNIQVHQAATVEGEEGEWITIIEDARAFDLLQLSGVEEILGEKEIEAGHYTQIRMDVAPVHAVIDGEDVAAGVVLPSGELKIVGSFDIEPDTRTILTIDFDAEDSLVFTGEGKVIFKPVVKLIVTTAEEST